MLFEKGDREPSSVSFLRSAAEGFHFFFHAAHCGAEQIRVGAVNAEIDVRSELFLIPVDWCGLQVHYEA